MLDRLTNGETLLIKRRRCGYSQSVTAAMFDVSENRYALWETGKLTKDCPRYVIKKMRDYETCLILRRRAGLTQKQVSRLVGVCVFYLRQMELGLAPCKRLKDYWDAAQTQERRST